MENTIEQRIKDLEEKDLLTTDNLFDAIWVIDTTLMTFSYISPSIERISGYSADEYIGTPVRERMSEEAYEKVNTVLNQSLIQLEKGPEPVLKIEVEMTHKNGGLYWVEIRGQLLQEKQDEPLKIVGVTRDITKRKKYEFSQEELIQRLNKVLAEKQLISEENKMLRKIIPICGGCKRIRGEDDQWWPLDVYVERHTDSSMTHTICPDCRAVIYGNE